jgi:hypothetical protein
MTGAKADWLGWVLQFIVGFVLGCLLGFIVISKGRYSTGYWVNSEVVLYFILGAGLLGGSLASHYGDRLWMDVRVFPLYENSQSRFSILLSVLIGLIGVGLMVFAVLKTIGIV